MKLLKKITIKDIFGKVGTLENLTAMKANGPMHIADIIGMARSAKPGSSPQGEYVAFLGMFRAVNAHGEEFQSGKCILVGAATDLLYGALVGKESGDVQFAFRISAHYDSTAITQYVYDIESLLKPMKSDPLLLLQNVVNNGGEIPEEQIIIKTEKDDVKPVEAPAQADATPVEAPAQAVTAPVESPVKKAAKKS